MEATGSYELYVKCKDRMNEVFGVMLMLKSDLEIRSVCLCVLAVSVATQ